jgi:capsid protein
MYEQMSGDLQGVTFSSLRQGTLEFRRFAGAMQKHVLIAGFNRPVWRRVMSIGQLAGALPPGASAAEWIAPRWGALQPLQDVQADMLAGRAGFESIPKIIKRYGNRPDRQLEEMADFAGELDGANLIIDSDARRTSRAGLTQSRTALELGGEDGGDQGDGDAGGSEPSTEG